MDAVKGDSTVESKIEAENDKNEEKIGEVDVSENKTCNSEKSYLHDDDVGDVSKLSAIKSKIAGPNINSIDDNNGATPQIESQLAVKQENDILDLDTASDAEETGTEDQNFDNDVDDDDIDDDDGDPIPSGTGSVSRDCSALDLVGWSEILPKWHSKLNQRPKGLNSLVQNGIPDPLRGEVWQLLSGAQESSDLMEQYRIFLMQPAPAEQIILRDVHRTYPAHENFQTGGSTSLLDSLFKVCKAYSVYDEEVGYCQGLSFLVAALLLHMPEEQAFCVFVRIMKYYGLRDLFRNNFDELYLKFYQLEHLLEEHMPDLHHHFARIGIEPFTYASQWFLTVFTAKFPLNAVFYIMDIFLLDGMNTIFQIALALLRSSKQELLELDFEGVLKYFRVQMPKRYRNQDNVQQLINASSSISLKKLNKFAKNYQMVKQKEKLKENPIIRLQRDNAKLTENNLRLEQENDDLARDLVASKIQLRAQLDMLEDKVESLNRALSISNQDTQVHLSTISDMEDEKTRLEVEVNQLKEVCRRELQRAESESARDSSIIKDYKKICSQISKRLDNQMELVKNFLDSMKDSLRDNQSCKDKLCHQTFQSKAEELMSILNQDNYLQNSEDRNGSPRYASARRISTDSENSTRPLGAYVRNLDNQSTSSEVRIQQLNGHIDELEVELARTKLALVEAECKCQQLTHDLNVGVGVRTTTSNQLGSLTSKLDFMKAAVSNRRSPKAASNALARINSLISERISTVSTLNQAASSPSSSSVTNNSTSNTTASSLHSPTSPILPQQRKTSSNSMTSVTNSNLSTDKC